MRTVLDRVAFSYGKKQVLREISLTADPGEIVVIAGPNGCGKSTLLSLVAGNLKPDAGVIARPERCGYVPQGAVLFEDLSVRDNLRFFASLAGVPVPDPLPAGLGPYGDVRVSRLSGGTRKRVSLTAACLGDPELLLLDEPAAFLDLNYRDEIVSLVIERKRAGTAVLYVSHDPVEFAPFYDKLLLISGGTGTLRTRQEVGDDLPELFARCLRAESLREDQRSANH